MKFTTSLMLAAVAGQAAAGTVSSRRTNAHAHKHALRHAEAAKEEQVAKRANLVSDTTGFLQQLGVLSGTNAQTDNGAVWLGEGGKYVNVVSNESGEDKILVVWGKAASWVNANAPFITQAVAAGSNVTFSIAEGQTLGWAAAGPNSRMEDGQIVEPFGEMTTNGIYTTYDVSYLTNMQGSDMSIVGPTCTSDKDSCSFKCADTSVVRCMTGYVLPNCDSANGGGQGIDNRPASEGGTGEVGGGCNGLNEGGTIYTTFH